MKADVQMARTVTVKQILDNLYNSAVTWQQVMQAGPTEVLLQGRHTSLIGQRNLAAACLYDAGFGGYDLCEKTCHAVLVKAGFKEHY